MFRLEGGRRQVRETRMRADFVVMSPPLLDAHLRVRAVAEPLQREMLIAELPVERFVRAILPRLAGVDERRFDLRRLEPPENRSSNELWTVVGAQVARRPVHAHELRQHL